MRQLQPDGAAADHAETFGQSLKVKDRFIGEKRDLVEAGNRRAGGTRSGGDDKAARLDANAVGLDAIRRDEAGMGAQHAHAHRLKARHFVIGRDGFDSGADVCAHSRHVDLRLNGGDAKPGAIAHRLRRMACCDKRF